MKNTTVKKATIAMEYTGQLRVSSTHLRSGTKIYTDAPVDNKGRGQAFSPTDLVANAMGSCLLTIMGIKAIESGITLKGLKAEITKIMASNPRRIERLEVSIDWTALGLTDCEKAVLKQAIHNCPVCNSLSKDLVIKIEYTS